MTATSTGSGFIPRNQISTSTPDGWAEFESRPETITVRGGRQLETVIRLTRHGPVLSDILSSPSPDSEVPDP